MVNNSTARNYGIIGTVVFHAIILALLLCVYLAYPSSDKLLEKQQEEKPMEVLLGGEYVMIGQFPDATIPGEPADEAFHKLMTIWQRPPKRLLHRSPSLRRKCLRQPLRNNNSQTRLPTISATCQMRLPLIRKTATQMPMGKMRELPMAMPRPAACHSTLAREVMVAGLSIR